MSRLTEPRDYLCALGIATTYTKGIKEAKVEALLLLDWAIQESDRCPPDKLLSDARDCFIKRSARR